MKVIANKEITYITKVPDERFLKIIDEPVTTDYFKLIMESCTIVPQGGFDYETIKNIDRVKKSIDAAVDSVVNLEDADYNFVVTCVTQRKWGNSSIEFVEFVDYIKSIN